MDTVQMSREELLGMTDLPWEKVTLPGGKFLIVQGLTGTELDRFHASISKQRNGKRNLDNIRARLAVRCIVSAPGGDRIFQSTDADIQALSKIRVDVLQKLFAAAQRVCGMDDEALDEMGKSFEDEGSGASSSS